jgi:HPt (histidine-containing phosphotransfer) domain-containing protein
MDKAIAEKDVKSFEILVHGIKSSSKMIGAMNVSEQAKALENKAEAGDLPDEAGYASFLQDYLNLADAVSSALMADLTPNDVPQPVQESKPEPVSKTKQVSKPEPAPKQVTEFKSEQEFESDDDGEIIHFAAKKR